MSAKKVKKTQAEQSDKTIQYIAIAIIVLVIGIFVWKYVPTSAPSTDVASGTACEPFAAVAATGQYKEAPAMGIDPAKKYFANFKMESGGEFVVQLYPDKAPITVNSFVFLACKGFYNGTTFHRVLEGFMAQGGDPTGTGSGGPGYSFVDEANDLVFDKPGMLAMANSGPNTNGSQFFITYAPTEYLNGKHTIFGEVTEGMDAVNAITRRDPNANPAFEGDKIQSVTISVE